MKERCRFSRELGALLLSLCALAFAARVFELTSARAQNTTPRSTSADAAQSDASQKGATAVTTPSPTPTPINWSADPLLKQFVWRGIGPASMGGRVDDIAVVESNPYVFYVGFATGGVWKTVNNGTTFQPIFDTYSTASIGDLAVAPSNSDIVWVGTGEANNRQSSSFGDGIYKSTDAGKTFSRMGLENSQTIARIVIDPRDPNVVYVAVPGHLFGPNKERGIYKTNDGGKSWNNVKFIDEDTGFTDLVIDPSDRETLYAASYQRRRSSWGFNGGGGGSGIWKTTDAGRTWFKLKGNGLPEGSLGRIGIDVSRSNPNTLYAQIEVGASLGTGGEVQGAFSSGINPEPTPSPSATQADRPNPESKKSGIWRSDDKGKTWHAVIKCSTAENCNNRPMYYSQIRVDPNNPENVYIGGLNFSKSTDGGKKFNSLQSTIAHSDHHAIWIDPKNGNHLLIGNDGGVDVSYDQGATWEFINTIPAAQFYAIAVDMRKPYYVYGGLQDNGSWGGPSQTRSPAGITHAEWYRIGIGDGFYVAADPDDYHIIYSESQDGRGISRTNLRTSQTVTIRPQDPPSLPEARSGQSNAMSAGKEPPSGLLALAARQAANGGRAAASNVVPTPSPGEPYRFYWNTPIVMSPHNSRVLYVGGDRLFRSLDRGDTWTASGDLTKHIDRSTLPIMGVKGSDPMASKNDGYSGFGHIVTIGESPIVPGVLWVGTDDGNVQLSKDDGRTWTNVAKNISGLSDLYHISRVEPSHFDAASCFVSIDGHRFDDLKPYLFVTRDYGATWSSIVGNLPARGNINVVRQDPRNKDLLYVGTDCGLYISIDGGLKWKQFMSGLPTVRVDDILVHPRDNDLVIGTHGRGIYVLDDITALQQLTQNVLDQEAFLFEVRPGTQWLNDICLSRYTGGVKLYSGTNPQPGTAISYYLKEIPSTEVKITVSDYSGKVIRHLVGTKETGINRIQWNLRGEPPTRPVSFQPARSSGDFNYGPPVEAGTYLLNLSVNGKDYTTKVMVDSDPILRF